MKSLQKLSARFGTDALHKFASIAGGAALLIGVAVLLTEGGYGYPAQPLPAAVVCSTYPCVEDSGNLTLTADTILAASINSINFDGVNDYLTRGAGLTGAADSKQVTLSFWINVLAADGGSSGNRIFQGVSSGIVSIFTFFREYSDNSLRIFARSTTGSTILDVRTNPNSAQSADGWLHILFSADMAAGTAHLYINDELQLNTTTFTNATIDFTGANWSVGAQVDGTQKYTGDIADLWFMPGVYIDFSQEANRRKFVSESGIPVYLGTDGSIPTGAAPVIYLSSATDSWHTNKGTGGGFTENGALTDGSSGPAPDGLGLEDLFAVLSWSAQNVFGSAGPTCFGNGTTCGTVAQTVTQSGVSDWESFQIGSDSYAGVAGSNVVRFYRVMDTCLGDGTTCANSSGGNALQSITHSGAIDLAVVESPQGTFAAVSNQSEVTIYKWISGSNCFGNGTTCGSAYHTIPPSYLYGGEFASIGSSLFLVYGNSIEPNQGYLLIYKWTPSGTNCPAGGGFGNGTNACRVAFQSLNVGASDRPTAPNFFTVGGNTYLWANNIDEGGSGNIMYQWMPGSNCFGSGTTCSSKYSSWIPGGEHGTDTLSYEIDGRLYGYYAPYGIGVWMSSCGVNGGFGSGSTCSAYYSAGDDELGGSYVEFYDTGEEQYITSISGATTRLFKWTPAGMPNCASYGGWGNGSGCGADYPLQTFTSAGQTGFIASGLDLYLATNNNIYKYSGTATPACTLYRYDASNGTSTAANAISSEGLDAGVVTEPTTFTLTCAMQDGGEENAVLVLGADPIPELSIAASPATLESVGGSSSVSWTASNVIADSCAVAQISPSNIASTFSAMEEGDDSAGQTTGALEESGTYTYRLACAGYYSTGSNAVLTGGVTTGISGEFGEALSLDGVDDWVDLSNGGTNNLGVSGAMTVSLWFWADNDNANQYLMDNRGPGSWWFIKEYTAGTLCAGISNNLCFEDRVAASDSDWNPGEWNHVAVTDDGTTASMYVNGVLVDTGPGESSSITTNLRIGTRYTNSTYFSGDVDEVRVYNRALAADEIETLYQGAHVVSGLVGYWSFDDEGVSATTAYDLAGGIASAVAEVEVIGPPADSIPTLTDDALTVSPERVRDGEPANVSWNVEGLVVGNVCAITSAPDVFSQISNGSGVTWVGGPVASSPITSRTQFTLLCTAPDGVTQTPPVTKTVNLVPEFQEI